jgi:hypothetical protein
MATYLTFFLLSGQSLNKKKIKELIREQSVTLQIHKELAVTQQRRERDKDGQFHEFVRVRAGHGPFLFTSFN